MPRIKRTLGIKTRKFDEQTFENNFRFPPKPDSYYDVKEKGICRWCDGVINNERGERNMRASWHPESISDREIIVNVLCVVNTTQDFK